MHAKQVVPLLDRQRCWDVTAETDRRGRATLVVGDRHTLREVHVVTDELLPLQLQCS
jgi:hypothetical protein